MNLADWQPCERPGQTRLVGSRIILEPLDWSRHREGLFAAIAGPENSSVWDYMPHGPYDEIQEFETAFEANREAGQWETLVFRQRDDGRIVGTSSYMRIRAAHGSVEIGSVAFGADLKRTAAAKEAMYLMASHVFDTLGYRRYEWKCHNDNLASKRAAERLGFVYEGTFRNDMVVKGGSRDTAWFAMTDADGQRLKPAYNAWLSPENFDSSGCQRRRLGEMFQ